MFHVSREARLRLSQVRPRSSCGHVKVPSRASQLAGPPPRPRAYIGRQLSITASVEPTILHLESRSRSLHVTWSDQRTSQFHWNWLRDHCQKATNASKLKTNALNLSPPKTGPVKTAIIANTLEVAWDDGLRSIYPLDWLRRNDYSATAQRSLQLETAPISWNKEEFQNHGMPTYEYRSILEDERTLYRLLSDVNLLGVAVVRQSGTGENVVRDLASKLASENFMTYEGVQDVTLTTPDVQDSELSSPHQDMCYYESPPGIQIVQCLSDGGEAKFLDGFRLAQNLRKNAPAHFELLSLLRQPFESMGERHRLLYAHPIIGVYNSEVRGICWSPPYEGVLNIYPEFVEVYYEAKKNFSMMISDPEYVVCHSMQPGEVLVVNNRRVLHAYTASAEQCRYRCLHVNLDHYLSRLRELAQDYAEKHDVIHQCGN
ncbi:trimethyllysine dioxygenase, mitochondrial-like isoform X2 [Schistocerca gregaria]|uniref:trimethyllysine dioxygenase, mitochondrial-like isoform X2 n=1 Tax=Schistocerca gregaria TaxID=7010 RepID=UPI00211E77C1|nr:trimethyllysine dioxygenase, mitochondrial-like isoform X2 [Schistocerca gregaria]